MKKIILLISLLISSTLSLATTPASLQIHVTHLPANGYYFLCLYDAGCYNLQSSSKGKAFPFVPEVLPNVKKIFIADARTNKMYAQPLPEHCQQGMQNEKPIKKVLMTGHFAVKNNVPTIQSLHCNLTA